MESRRSVRKLADSIHSLLGLKKQLTSNWADSVCNIIKGISSEEEPFNCTEIKCINSNLSEKEDYDVDSIVSKIQGKYLYAFGIEELNLNFIINNF